MFCWSNLAKKYRLPNPELVFKRTIGSIRQSTALCNTVYDIRYMHLFKRFTCLDTIAHHKKRNMRVVGISCAVCRAVGTVENTVRLQLKNEIASKTTLVALMQFQCKCIGTRASNVIGGIHMDKRIHLLRNFAISAVKGFAHAFK